MKIRFLTSTIVSLATIALGGSIYWTDIGTDKIFTSDQHGENVSQLVSTGLTAPGDIVLDEEHGHMYWTDTGPRIIQRANLDGSGVSTIISDANVLNGLTIDSTSGHLYWVDGARSIIRSDLNGINRTTLLSGNGD